MTWAHLQGDMGHGNFVTGDIDILPVTWEPPVKGPRVTSPWEWSGLVLKGL